MASMPRIILIDAHALCYRAFYAVKDLRNSKGAPTNAVFGFVNILKKLLTRYQPSFVAACFDVGRYSKRKEKYVEYKAHRSAMPEDMLLQMPVIKEVVTAFRIPQFAVEGYEADDVIAVLTRRFSVSGVEVIIVSDDKDLYQLLAPGISIYNSRRDTLLNADDTKERFGVAPSQMVDYLALAGDTSDNIPGVDGIGEVTAQKLLVQYGSLDNLLSHADELKGKLKEKIQAGRGAALLSRELATLDMDTPVDCQLSDLQWNGADTNRLKQIFTQLEFRVLLDGLQPVKEEFQLSFSDPQGSHIHSDFLQEVPLVDVSVFVRQAISSGQAAFIFDKKGGFAAAVGAASFQSESSGLEPLRAVLESDDVIKVMYDSKVSRRFLAQAGIKIKGTIFDVLLAGYLMSSGQSAHSLEALAWSILKRPMNEDVSLAKEAEVVLALYKPLVNMLKDRGLWDLYSDMEYPLSGVLLQMEKEGVGLDVELLARLSRDSEEKIGAMTQKLYVLAGEEFNCNSSKQLGVILFEKLKLSGSKKTKTGFSTDEEVLTRLASQHELPALILEYRQLAKLKSTYIDALPKMVDPLTGRIHCSFNQAGTETGRLSSSHPNLQNIPIRTEEGRMIRRAFIPSGQESYLMSADYSQIELRVLAHLADDQDLKKAFLKGEDIHTFTAALIFDVEQKDVTSDMRYSAKRINFGIIYGMSAFGLAKDLGVSPKEAKGFIERYFMRYPGIKAFMDREIEKAHAQGYVETLFHRRRYLPEINSRNQAIRQFAERQAVNTPVQGTAADIIKIAMIRMADEISRRNFDSRMIITVHDELVFNVPKKDIQEFSGIVRLVMETAVKLSVPIDVTVKYGMNWSEMKKI